MKVTPPAAENLQVDTLGPRRFPSPLSMSTVEGDGIGNFTPDESRVAFEIVSRGNGSLDPVGFELAGAREKIFFDPPKTTAAIVTCGGLCPGLNNVIRTLYFELSVNYGIRQVLGIRYGYEGLNPEVGAPPIVLHGDMVENIHKLGGSILGSSRGPQDPDVMVDFLQQNEIDILFCVGGDGTQKGAHALARRVKERKLPISIIGIPKTIDNDIQYVWRTFGFFTALGEAQRVIRCAHNEANGMRYGVGLVKLMGREAGFIAAGATIASGQVNFTLIPEVPFELDGNAGLLAKVERRLRERGHAVIVVAEGAGQDLLLKDELQYDASGNPKLGDIGTFLKKRLEGHFADVKLPAKVKYLDPSYHIRSVPANTADALLCEELSRSAAHAAMAGKTDALIGLWHNQTTHVPIELATSSKKRLSPESGWWITVRAMTGQEQW